MLQFKIQDVCNHVEKHKHHTEWKNDVKNMKEAIKLIDRCMDDDYYRDEAFKEVHKKYGKSICWETSKVFNDKHGGTMITFRYEKETYKNEKQVRKDVTKAYEKMLALSQKDWKRLFEILEQNLTKWWC